MKNLVAVAVAVLSGPPVLADVNVTFLEGAPKDRFVVANTGSCDLKPMKVTLDLSTSASGVIFDVTGRGAGVEVFQPFEIISGVGYFVGTPSVADGDQVVTLSLKSLPRGKSVVFTIDVDNTRGGREITVANSDIRGATASVQTTSRTFAEEFKKNAEASIRMPACSPV